MSKVGGNIVQGIPLYLRTNPMELEKMKQHLFKQQMDKIRNSVPSKLIKGSNKDKKDIR